MNLKNALKEVSSKNNSKDILELVWIKFRNDYLDQDYYDKKIDLLPRWNYFISDLDGTFFRWVLQKEAVSLFIKFVNEHNYLDFDLEKYYDFLNDVKHFNELEKKAYNKKIEFFEYLNAWIYLLLKHRKLVNWDDYLFFIKQNFIKKEKINPFRFSFSKIKEVLESGDNFIFISWAPNFIFEIYLELLKDYVSKNIWKTYSNSIFWFWSNLFLDFKEYTPLWWREHKNTFINILKDKDIILNIIWWMWDTSSDFWISYSLDKNKDFYFVNPEKKVLEKFDEFFKKDINYHMIIERKDLIIEINKKDITFL